MWGILYFLAPIFILIWAKIKTDIKIYRVILLSFLPLLIVSVLFYIMVVVDSGEVLNSLEVIYMVIFYGYILFFPVLIFSALYVKFLQIKGEDTLLSAALGSILGVFLFVLISTFLGAIDSLFTPLIVFTSGFVSVLIEDKIFKGKQ